MLVCDFSEGFKEPEMVKAKSPIIILAGSITGRQGLVAVVCLSTRKPDPVMPYHLLLPKACLPQLVPHL